MATTDRSNAGPAAAASDVAAAIRSAELVQVIAPADGDCLAAAGLLAAACDSANVPSHVGVARTADGLADRLGGADATATTVVLGTGVDDAISLDPDGPVSPLAYEVATALGGNPPPSTALAGLLAAGAVPSRAAPDLLEAAGIERRPGVGVPTGDLADGLAHSGLVHAPFSGDLAATREALASCDLAGADATDLPEDDARNVASLVAIAATGPEATARAATAVERVLRPYPTDGPFTTLDGHADVLCSLAERAPGLAVSLAVSDGDRPAALDAWRAHGRAVHAAVRAAELTRHRGVVVARTDGPVTAVARLLRDYRSPEPVVLAVAETEAAAASVETPVSEPLDAAARAAGGSALARGRAGVATFDPDRDDRLVEAFREALS